MIAICQHRRQRRAGIGASIALLLTCTDSMQFLGGRNRKRYSTSYAYAFDEHSDVIAIHHRFMRE